jgi:glycosyltransferase involved in cell wall biosynthesis
MNTMRTESPAVIIVGPAWPRGGTARVMQNQVEFYRSRGYVVVFVCVPFHCAFVESHPAWGDIKSGMQELGADQTFIAPIDKLRFSTAKYTAWVGRAFRGTALDWIVFTAKSARLPDDANRFIRDLPIALIHVNHVFTLGFAQRLLRQVVRSAYHVPMLLETHDVQAHVLQDRGEINPWTHDHDTLDRLLHSEFSYLNKMKVLVHCSVDDFNFFKERLPNKQHILTMPTIDEFFVSDVNAACQSSIDSIDLLFVGQSTDPNRAAIQWFFEQVWPLIADRGYSVKIVGQIDMLVRKNLPGIYQAFGSYFVGPVAELAPFYRAARCVFAPMVSGTGISIKTIEALALGKPFVGTSKAYRGMPMDQIAQAGLKAHDTPQAFANAIVRALSEEQLATVASRAAYNDLFSKRAAYASRDEALRLATAS